MPKRSWLMLVPLVLLLGLALPGAAFAQTSSTSGEISGRITDSAGAALPGVTVTATNVQTGLTRTTYTGDDGSYTLGLLPPGTYDVTAELQGLGTSRKSGVAVLLGRASNVRLTLSPQISEEITVTADAPLVDTTEADLSTSVTEDQIDSLPILGRDFKDLVLLTPGTGEAFGGRVSVNGARGIQTDFNVDGAEANSDFFGEERGGTEAPYVFSQAAIREFQVIRSTYSAEYSRGVGGTMNAITKSGTNEIEAELFYFLRDQDWADERSAVLNGQQVEDAFEARDSDQYGLAAGGPLRRDKLFLFVAADFQDISEPLLVRDIRTTSNFQALPSATQAAFLSRVDQLLGGTLDRQFRFDSRQDQEVYLVRLDGNLGGSHHAFLRYNSADYNNFPSEGAGDILSNNGDEFNKVQSTVLQMDSIFGTSLTNELILQHGLEERPIFALENDIPETVIQDIDFTFGRSEFLPNRTDEDKWQLKNNLTWLAGNHQIKGGVEYLSTEIDNLFPREAGGQWFFSTTDDFLAGNPNRLDQGFGPTLGLNAFDYEAWGVFLQNTQRVGDHLTFDYGIRYDRQSVPDPVGNAYPSHPEFVSDFKEDTDNWAPRLGFAWDLQGDGRSVLRGGVGRFFNPLPSILYAGPLAEIAGLYNRITLSCSTGRCPTYPDILTPEQFAREARTSSNVTVVSPDLEAVETIRTSLAYEQLLGQSYSVSVEGVYSQFDNAQRLVNINVVPSGLTYGNLVVYDTRNPNRRYPDLQAVRMHVSDAEGEYTALTLGTRKLALGDSKLSWLAHYTWSEAIDQDSNERSTSTSFSLDPFDPEISEGLADYDIEHRFLASGTYELPWGIRLSGIFTWRSGTPYTAGIDVSGFAGLNGLDFTGVDTPVFVDRGGNMIDLTAANGLTPQQLSAFLAERGARLEERNSERQPDYRNLDLRLSKAFDLGQVELELIGEVFNVLNEEIEFVTGTNQSAFSGELRNGVWTFRRNPDFGKSNSFNFVSVPRQYQLALRLRY
ncbi:MAG TPA: TonB-dependent receptor [Thermoanaerobaculia bacterium]|nr:TonB-dependent receptor [Thermoanaerobaculia bacterium]